MTETILQVSNIRKKYTIKGKEKEILRGISFELSRGTLVSLLGINGAGKTTLSSILVTLIPSSSGEMFWNGYSIQKNLYAYRKIIGYCPQKPNLDRSLTLRQNLIYAGSYFGLSKTVIHSSMEKIIRQFSLEEVIEQPVDTLSCGYRQRFLLARTLIHNPQLIVLDEPTVGLDPSARKEVHRCIRSICDEGKTVLMATHYLEEAEVLSDKILVMHQGEIVLSSSPEALNQKEGQKKLEDIFLRLINANKFSETTI